MKKLIIALLFLSFSTQGFAQFFKDNKILLNTMGILHSIMMKVMIKYS